MVISKETKKEGINTWKNIVKISDNFAFVMNFIFILIAIYKYLPFKIEKFIFLITLSFITSLISIFIIVGYFFHYLFYIKALKEIGFEKIIKEGLFTKLKRKLTIIIVLLVTIVIYFMKNIINAFSIEYLDIFTLVLSIYLTNLCIVLVSITSLIFYYLIRIISKIFLENTLKTIFLITNAIIIIYFLNILLAITALKENKNIFLVIAFISNILLIYALHEVSSEYYEKIEEL